MVAPSLASPSVPSSRAGSSHEERLYAEVNEWQSRVAKNHPNALAQLVSSVLMTRDAETALRVTEELRGGSFATGRSDISAPQSTASVTLLLAAIDWECLRPPSDLESESDESDAGSGHASATISAPNTASIGQPLLPSGLVTAPNATPHHDKLLLKLVHTLADLCDTRRGDNDQPSARLSLAVTDPTRTRAVLERAVDSSFSDSHHDVLVKAYALYSLSVLVPKNKSEYMRQLAQLPAASIPDSEPAARLIHRASRQLSQRSPRIIVPSYAIFPASPNGFTAAPIPFPSDGLSGSRLNESSSTNSRNGSRSNSLFSVAVTPASYDSRGTSSIASPVSSSPEDKPSPASGSVSPSRPRGGNTNPLLAQVLNRRLARGRTPSLVGSPTSGVTACASQSMASFAPPDAADLQESLAISRDVPRPRAQSAAPERTRSATLPSSGIASRSLRALSTVDVNRSSRMRPTLPWTKRWSLWSAGDDDADSSQASAPATPAQGMHARALPSEETAVNYVVTASDIPDASSVRSAPVGRTYSDDPTFGGPLPPLHPALAKQEKCSRLLESRVCAQCGAHGGSFPQCARGCGVAWCSRECRMESRKVHKAICGVLANGDGRMSTVG